MQKRYLALFLSLLFLLPLMAQNRTRTRTPIKIPDVPGYKTLSCDLHIHTVFSDGSVWPDVRPEEAWREGLDVIAITDHLEYQPHKQDLPTNHNRSYEIAKPRGDILDIIVVRGSEVTRDMPPGHLNAIFLESSLPLDTEEWPDAIKAAHDQGAFIFWNHPGWKGQQPDKVARWYPEHTQLLEQGMMHGIEVVNEREYYPEAHRWCIEKKLTMLSNSDIHAPLNLDYMVRQGDHRPMTLVFAQERSLESIKEALFARRTAVYSGALLIGDETYLAPIFTRSILIKNPVVTIEGDGRAYVQIRNYSDIEYELEFDDQIVEIELPDEGLALQANRTVLLELRGTSEDRSGTEKFTIPFTVRNLLVEPDIGLRSAFEIEVTFVPEEE
jgi:hypothetical protein